MPLMAYLTMDDPSALARGEFMRLGLAAAPGPPESLPYSERHLRDFEERYCYDRYWNEQDREHPGTRFICRDASSRRWATAASDSRRPQDGPRAIPARVFHALPDRTFS